MSSTIVDREMPASLASGGGGEQGREEATLHVPLEGNKPASDL